MKGYVIVVNGRDKDGREGKWNNNCIIICEERGKNRKFGVLVSGCNRNQIYEEGNFCENEFEGREGMKTRFVGKRVGKEDGEEKRLLRDDKCGGLLNKVGKEGCCCL